MRAALCTAYGGPDVIVVSEVERPIPREMEILVRICATTVSAGDARLRGANFPPGFALPARLAFGITKPRQPVLGVDLAGVVEAVGKRVTRFRPGDEVFAMAGMKFGCHAEFKVIREDGAIAPKPANLSFAEAAALPFGGTTALHFLRGPGRLNRGERVLVNGASGAVGSTAVQLAKHFGAHVTGVTSATNAALVRALGADQVIDYKAQDFAATGQRWDVILDTVGNITFAQCRPVLAEQGRLMLIVAGLHDLLKAPFQSKASGLTVAGGTAPERAEDLRFLGQLAESRLLKPVIDSRTPFEEIANAHKRADSGRKVGAAVVVL